MRRAIAISARGLGTTSPNPPVGCVILDRAGELIGEGYHRRKGEPHAEANALTAAGARAAGGTALVTLEPCNHHGLTPPCRAALIGAGVARVVVAVLDPTSRGEGGVAALRAAGVSVELGTLEEEALVVLDPWLAALRTGLPTLTWVYGIGANGEPVASHRLKAPDVEHDVLNLRASIDVVLTEEAVMSEGRPGEHGPGVFRLPPTVPPEPLALLRALAEGGARTVLIDAGQALVAPLTGVHPIGRVVAYLPDRPPSSAPVAAAHPLLPAGHRLAGIARVGTWLRVEGTPA